MKRSFKSHLQNYILYKKNLIIFDNWNNIGFFLKVFYHSFPRSMRFRPQVHFLFGSALQSGKASSGEEEIAEAIEENVRAALEIICFQQWHQRALTAATHGSRQMKTACEFAAGGQDEVLERRQLVGHGVDPHFQRVAVSGFKSNTSQMRLPRRRTRSGHGRANILKDALDL